MVQTLAAFGIAFVLGAVLSRAFRRSLVWLVSRERKAGKETIHRLFPKPRRPLGGGLAIMFSATASVLLVPLLSGRWPRADWAAILCLAWGYASIGLADDLKKAQGRGLRERSKLALQLAVALAAGLLLWRLGGTHTVRVPFAAWPVDFGVFIVPFAALVILATANAVNLSDGIDGLAGGSAIISLLGLASLSLVDPVWSIGVAGWALVGAILGFLIYNLPPARLLMGDTGALAVGAALAGLAILARVEFWLLVLAAPFVVNAASVVVQMTTVRGLWRILRPLRHARTETGRPFLCTPLHHHFQSLGWNEWRVLGLYWGFGAVMSAWAVLAYDSGVLWLIGLLATPAFLVAAALQKLLRANYFLGLLPRDGQPPVVALYRGLPLEFLGWPLHRVQHETTITEGMLVGATAESILWRPITQIEAHVVLGKIYADHKLFDQTLSEWEQVPTRNLLIRPSVVLRLARIYYGQDRLLEAIKLWEQLPPSRLEEMPNVREVVRSVKLRLADLATKSHRQSMRALETAERTGDMPPRFEQHLLSARQFNQDLLSLLLYERDKLRGRPGDPAAARARRALLHRTRSAVMARIEDLDDALGSLARATPEPSDKIASPSADVASRAAQELRLSRERLTSLISAAGDGRPHITRAAVHPKASRNTVYRLSLVWPGRGPSSVIVKHYASDRIAFFSACYRRERGVLELLQRYGAAVPRVYSGELSDNQAILVLQDLGDETLAERLEASDPPAKEHWLRSAVSALVSLHATAHRHLADLAAEIGKIDKERLGSDYYFSAVRIALERLVSLADVELTEAEWSGIADQARPLVDFLCGLPSGFIHFEFTPHHLLVTDAGPHIFDFEQATIGPLEFDLAALLAQPESELDLEGWERLVEHYAVCARESGLPVGGAGELPRAVSYATLFKCLVYAGAAANFLDKFGGEHHVQRLRYYLDRCQRILARWPPLRPLGLLLEPHFRAARATGPHQRPHFRPRQSG
jgi:phospho-N-acetylmuramoyl-pentapeptide-transferase